MTLIVENGTGLVDAESYISVADATTYHANRGNTAWAAILTDGEREILLRKATDYMVAAYRHRWAGFRKTTAQALDFPRDFVPIKDGFFEAFLDNNFVPIQVKNACAELALRALADDLMPDLEQGVVREKVDVIEVEYADFSPQQKRFSQVDAMLSIYFSSGSNQAKLVRS